MSIQLWTLRASSSYDNETDVFGEMIKPQEGDIRVVKKSDFDRAISLNKDLVRALKDYIILQKAYGIEPRWTAELLKRAETEEFLEECK